ncbi:MAG: cyclic nucleotide-binding domain-containing protein [Trichormus sp.]
MNMENFLTQLLILKGLSKQQRQKILEIGEIEQYQYGEHIFDEGTENHALYIVLEGKIDIFIDPAFQANVEKGTICHNAAPGIGQTCYHREGYRTWCLSHGATSQNR